MVRENGMVMMTEEEYAELIKNKDQKVTRREFLDLYNAALTMRDYYDGTDEKERFNHVYGYDVTVHWNGVYCNCSDGATAYNHIICGVEGADEELDDIED